MLDVRWEEAVQCHHLVAERTGGVGADGRVGATEEVEDAHWLGGTGRSKGRGRASSRSAWEGRAAAGAVGTGHSDMRGCKKCSHGARAKPKPKPPRAPGPRPKAGARRKRYGR